MQYVKVITLHTRNEILVKMESEVGPRRMALLLPFFAHFKYKCIHKLIQHISVFGEHIRSPKLLYSHNRSTVLHHMKSLSIDLNSFVNDA